MKRRILLMVSAVFALLALLLEGGLALYWTGVLAPRLSVEASQQAQVLAQSQAGVLSGALAEEDPQRRSERIGQVIDELLLLRDAQRGAPFFTGIGLELDYDALGGQTEVGSLDRPLTVNEQEAYAVTVDLYQRDGGELLGIAQFGVSKSFFLSFIRDLRQQMVWQAALVAAVLALLWGSLAWLLIRHENQRAKFALAMEAARDAAEAASRSKSQFLANMSHEIRTPMNAVIGLGTLLGKTALDPHQQALQKQLADSAQLLLGIIDDILDLSRIEADKLPVQRVEFALDQVWSDLRSVLGTRASDKGLELLYRVAADAPARLRGDPGRLKQVLVNLVNNAIKFTERGEVSIELSVVERNAADCLLRFVVSDTGIGIAPELLPRMFDAFTQVDESNARRHGGAGLGLAICKRLVELMGGTLSASSDPGYGSRFTFTVRLGVLPPVDARIARPTGLRALVVDGHLGARDVLGSMLESLRFDVTLADSAEQALPRLAQSRYDLLLIENTLPGMGGVALISELRRRRMSVPAVVLLSAQFSDAMRKQARDAQIDVHLAKPVSPSSLLDAAMQALGDAQRTPGQTRAAQTPLAVEPAEVTRPFAVGCRVLLAEDHAINQQVALALLGELGLEVQAASDGATALALLRRSHFDAVLMDVQMPGMDGLTATRLLKSDPRLKHLPVIALTAHAMSGDRERFLQAGMDDYLAKPIDEAALLRVLKRWLPAAGLPSAAVQAAAARETHGAGEAALPEIPGMDIVGALRRLGGKRALYWQLLDDFRNRHSAVVSDLREALRSGRTTQAQQLAHAIKGAAATLGAEQIAAAAARLESAAAAGGDPVALEQLTQGFAQLQTAVLPLISASHPAGAATGSSGEAAGSSPLKALLHSLDHALSRNDLSASEHFAALAHMLPVPRSAAHLQLELDIATLDFVRARKSLRLLREALESRE